MDVFVVYLAPALFYRVLATTLLQEWSRFEFALATTLGTFSAFALSFLIGLAVTRGRVREATIVGLAGSYGNVGYMGPGLAISTLGPQAAAPVALVFCFDTLIAFSLAPLLMAMSDADRGRGIATAVTILGRIVLHPVIVASALGVASAATGFTPPVAVDRLLQFLQSAAAPCALFAIGVTIAARPAAPIPREAMLAVGVKLVLHPLIAMAYLWLLGPFPQVWVYTAVLLAALPPALSVFVLARQYGVWANEASGAILFGVSASVVTVSVMLWLVETRALPLQLFP